MGKKGASFANSKDPQEAHPPPLSTLLPPTQTPPPPLPVAASSAASPITHAITRQTTHKHARVRAPSLSTGEARGGVRAVEGKEKTQLMRARMLAHWWEMSASGRSPKLMPFPRVERGMKFIPSAL